MFLQLHNQSKDGDDIYIEIFDCCLSLFEECCLGACCRAVEVQFWSRNRACVCVFFNIR